MNLEQWFDKNHIHSRIIAEFDDSALMKAFGQEKAGIFNAPAVIQAEVEGQYNAIAIGQTTDVTEQIYAISTARYVSHPVISAVVEVAHESLFSNTK